MLSFLHRIGSNSNKLERQPTPNLIPTIKSLTAYTTDEQREFFLLRAYEHDKKYFPKKGIMNAIDNHGKTALIHAVLQGNLSTVELLCAHHNHTDRKEMTDFLLACQKISLDHADHKGRTALIHAVLKENLPMVKLLCTHQNINLDHVDHTGTSALIYAATKGNLDILTFLTQFANTQEEAKQKKQTPKLVSHFYKKPSPSHWAPFMENPPAKKNERGFNA